MKEIKLTIDGKDVQLTEEQLKALGAEANKRINPFEKVIRFEDYYFIEKNSEVYAYMDTDSSVDDRLYTSANYFNDKAFAEQVALHQLLYRKLLKFAYDNEYEDVAEWNGSNSHWAIRYNDNRKEFDSYCQNSFKARDIYFSSEKGAERAIYEVVDPFMKEHPDFVW